MQFLRQDIVQLVEDTLEDNRSWIRNTLNLSSPRAACSRTSSEPRQVLRSLKKLGVRVAIDDFGVGFSSLSYLKNFDVDTLKIDRSFISSLLAGSRDEAIVRAIISLAESLELKVVAEGVETNPQLACLLSHACDEAQGYLFSRPVPSDIFEALLKDHPRYLLPKQGMPPKKAQGS